MSPEVSEQDARIKKRQVGNLRSRSVSHSAFHPFRFGLTQA